MVASPGSIEAATFACDQASNASLRRAFAFSSSPLTAPESLVARKSRSSTRSSWASRARFASAGGGSPATSARSYSVRSSRWVSSNRRNSGRTRASACHAASFGCVSSSCLRSSSKVTASSSRRPPRLRSRKAEAESDSSWNISGESRASSPCRAAASSFIDSSRRTLPSSSSAAGQSRALRSFPSSLAAARRGPRSRSSPGRSPMRISPLASFWIWNHRLRAGSSPPCRASISWRSSGSTKYRASTTTWPLPTPAERVRSLGPTGSESSRQSSASKIDVLPASFGPTIATSGPSRSTFERSAKRLKPCNVTETSRTLLSRVNNHQRTPSPNTSMSGGLHRVHNVVSAGSCDWPPIRDVTQRPNLVVKALVVVFCRKSQSNPLGSVHALYVATLSSPFQR